MSVQAWTVTPERPSAWQLNATATGVTPRLKPMIDSCVPRPGGELSAEQSNCYDCCICSPALLVLERLLRRDEFLETKWPGHVGD